MKIFLTSLFLFMVNRKLRLTDLSCSGIEKQYIKYFQQRRVVKISNGGKSGKKKLFFKIYLRHNIKEGIHRVAARVPSRAVNVEDGCGASES